MSDRERLDRAELRAFVSRPWMTGWTRGLRRLNGYWPETPARSAMHAAYRGKTRRRGRK